MSLPVFRDLLKRLSSDETTRLVGLALLLGLAAGGVVVAYDAVLETVFDKVVLEWLDFDFNRRPFTGLNDLLESGTIYFPVVLAIGLAASAFVMRHWFAGIGAHSTDRVIDAFHNQNGQLPLTVAFAVAIASLFTVGFGGSAGLEAQSGLIGAAVAVALGHLLGVQPRHRRLVLLMGLSAGFSAAFKTPLGAAFVAVEILYRDLSLEAEALIYTIVAAVVAYVLAGTMHGWESEFLLPVAGEGESAGAYVAVVCLGVVAGIFAAFMPTLFFGLRDFVRRVKAPYPLLAIAGGAVIGIIGLVLPQTVGDGGLALSPENLTGIPPLQLLAIGAVKIATISLTLAVGGVGGVLSPTLFIGGVLGAAFAQMFGLPVLEMTVVGMGTIFAAVARVPIGTLLMVTELTGSYAILPETAFGVAISYFIQFALAERLKYPSIHGEQPPTLWNSPAHQDQVLAAGIGLLQRGGIELPEGLQLPDLRALLSIGYPIKLGHGDLVLFTSELSEDSPAVGRTLGDAPLGEGIWLLEIRHGDATLQPQRDSVLSAGDNLVLMAPLNRLPTLLPHLRTPTVLVNWLARHEPDCHAACFGGR